MGPKTFKRSVIFLTTVLVLAVLIFFMQRKQVEKMDRGVLALAAQAEKEGNLDEAGKLYQEHLEIAPDDVEAKQAFAELLLKGPKDPARWIKAADFLREQVTQHPDDKATSLRLAKLEVEMGQFQLAGPSLGVLRNSMAVGSPNFAEVCFLLGRCQEESGDFSRAKESYRDAIKFRAPERIEASARLAALILSPHDKPDEEQAKAARKEADAIIKAMVNSDPNNYEVYLQRGRYLRLFGQTRQNQEDARKDLHLVLEKKPSDKRIYEELVDLEQSAKNYEEANRVIVAGIKALDDEAAAQLRVKQAMLQWAGPTGTIGKAIASLHKSIETIPDQAILRLNLANLLALRGDTDELPKQIEHLKRLNVQPVLISLFEARCQINRKEWKKAIQLLVRLQTQVEPYPDLNGQVHYFMAQCYGQLGDHDREREQYGLAVRANPKNFEAHVSLAASMARLGEIENAINEYRQLLSELQPQGRDRTFSAVCSSLIQLLIRRETAKPADQRDWSEVDKLVELIKQSAPQSSELLTLQTEVLLAQDRIVEAQTLLAKARCKHRRI